MRTCFYVVLVAAAAELIGVSYTVADEPVIVAPGTPGAVMRPGQPPGGPPGGPSSKPGQENGKEAEAKPDEKKSESTPPKVIRRDETTRGEANPDELKATVGEDGKVAFEFRNQPWLDLVQWLSQISDTPLDWQELPADRVNLTSPGRYTIEETRDLFNRHLLARGFTLLKLDDGIIIAKTENINPAIVPRVEPSELASLAPYTFVRTSLDVSWLSAEKLATELKPMVSSNGRLTALTSTNRIEAMDAATNLRQIADLLASEHSAQKRESLAPEFRLRFLPAEEAKTMLEEFLGVKKEKQTPPTPEQLQMMQQMRQQQGNQLPPETKAPEVSIVANSRQNSIIIRATPDRIAIAMEFLKRIDVASESMVSLSDVQSRVQVFRLASLDPEKLIEIISEMNVLEPTTRLRVDKENKALIVSGGGADRFIINSLIERLDGSGRQFEVLQLRRLEATEVAESIAFLMGQKKEEKQENRRSYYYFDPFQNNKKDEQKDEFRVAANTRYRQILLWANEIEMAEVRSLLVKLGELPPQGGSRQTVRVIDAAATPETYEYLQRLKTQWQQLSPNPIELPDASQFKEPNPNSKPIESPDDPLEQESSTDSVNDVTLKDPPESSNFEVLTRAQEQAVPDDLPHIKSAKEFDQLFGGRARQQSPAEPSPFRPGALASISITLDRDGNLVISSPDTDALDKLESLMLQVTPPQRPYRVFSIQHASATWMRLNLEDYFKDMEDEGPSEADRFYSYFWGIGTENKKKGPTGLGAGVKLRFIDDLDTNTLVVTGASNDQLRTISELIALWDVPEPVNKRKTRFTKLVTVQYSKADKIAETVKDAYRDLLSSNDKAFQAANQGQNNAAAKEGTPRNRGGIGSGLVDSTGGRNGGSEDFSFKGRLSVGIDSVGNTLLVSAEGEQLLDLVTDMIRQLDEAARPGGEVEILRLSGGMSGKSLEQALQAFGAGGGREEQARESRNSRDPGVSNRIKPESETE
jgi:type II secretory pathway component GspD/PulD (secretin)